MNAALETYEASVQPARDGFANHPVLRTALAPDVDPHTLELFFIHYTALGVYMTEPVESWIARAGQRCDALGLRGLGRAFALHAKHEADHHLMMIEDTKRLVSQRNERVGTALRAEDFLSLPPTPGVRAYVDLHEATIAGDTPYCQMAIEYEIERLSLDVGAHVLVQCRRVLGEDALRNMSFLEEHVAIDEGHTNFNRNELRRLLAEHPEYGPPLVAAGKAALAAYTEFMTDCWALAQQALRAQPSAAGASGARATAGR